MVKPPGDVQRVEGHWLTESGWLVGACRHGDRVLEVLPVDSDEKRPDDLPWFLPAPVDLHVHGGGGHDCMAGDDALRGMLRAQARLGTGALLATSVTMPNDNTDAFLDSVARVMASPDEGSSILLGAHLEGPFISPDKLGAQPPYPQPLDLDRLKRWLSTGVVRVMTYAAELDPEQQVPILCEQFGVKAQLGHSACDWATALQALSAGVGITHLYNAMSGVQHRDGGLATAALAAANYAEIITDGVHVDRAAFLAAQRAIPRLYSVTDGTAASGMPDGRYRLGDVDVHKRGDRVQLANGALAGSCLTSMRSVQVLREWGQTWTEIANMMCVRPADWIGAADFGRIQPGAYAHWLELRQDKIVALWLSGCRHPLNTGTSDDFQHGSTQR